MENIRVFIFGFVYLSVILTAIGVAVFYGFSDMFRFILGG